MPRKPQEQLNLEALMGNKPPQALDVEEAVLGAMLVEPATIDESMEELSAGCFYDPRHRKIFEAMSALVNEHVSIDIVTVSEKLRSRGDLEEIGGPVELARLSQNIGAAAHIEYYIKILKQKTIQRDLISASYDILKQSFDESTNVDDLIDNAQTKVFAAIQNNVKRDVQDIGSIINSVLDNLQELQGLTGPSGVPSGYPSIDRVTQGWQKSDLIILAARPSVGKTAFALNIARNAAVDANMPVAVFSLEMSADQLGKRLITTESGLSGEKIKGGVKLESYEWIQLEDTLKRLAKAPLYIDTARWKERNQCLPDRGDVRETGSWIVPFATTGQITFEQLQIVLGRQFDVLVRTSCEPQAVTEVDHHCVSVGRWTDADARLERFAVGVCQFSVPVRLRRGHPANRFPWDVGGG